MNYPASPFSDNFNTEILIKPQNKHIKSQIEDSKLIGLLTWLCSSPRISSYRVNLITHSVEDVFYEMKEIIHKITDNIKIELCSYLPDVIIIKNVDVTHLDISPTSLEVIVDVQCAAAVLRGAHVFAPGIMGMQSGTKVGDKVSVYADVENNCRKGFQKVFDSPKKIFLGNGIAKLTRSQLFGENLKPRGVAVEMYSNIAGCLAPGIDNFLKGSCLLQNLPSIICVHVLNPQPGETVLDMCASPGNKTTHIAALMNNKGTLVAIDKTPSKIIQLREKCRNFEAKAVIYQADSTKIYNCNIETSSVLNGPPFGRECFDKILLDAPCSGLGQRPQLYNDVSEKVVKSYVPLQKKLFQNAVHLLKLGGHLVYCTCTITLAENEELVAWALSTYKCLTLCKGKPHLGGKGWYVIDLSDTELKNVQRFDNNGDIDSIGFFIAYFVKNSSL